MSSLPRSAAEEQWSLENEASNFTCYRRSPGSGTDEADAPPAFRRLLRGLILGWGREPSHFGEEKLCKKFSDRRRPFRQGLFRSRWRFFLFFGDDIVFSYYFVSDNFYAAIVLCAFESKACRDRKESSVVRKSLGFFLIRNFSTSAVSPDTLGTSPLHPSNHPSSFASGRQSAWKWLVSAGSRRQNDLIQLFCQPEKELRVKPRTQPRPV